jgi:hypothetical protein
MIEDNLEKTLTSIRRARAVAAVTELQLRSVAQGTDAITPEEIDAEIAAVRRERRERRSAQG